MSEKTPSSSRFSYMRCIIRKEYVAACPEEIVRQKTISSLLQLGYPLAHISLEKELAQMPHLAGRPGQTIPRRRADIICFSSEIHPEHALYPLLLIECKAHPLRVKAFEQAIGYNYFMQAYFIALVNKEKQKLGWYDATDRGYRFIDGLLSYQELKARVRGIV